MAAADPGFGREAKEHHIGQPKCQNIDCMELACASCDTQCESHYRAWRKSEKRNRKAAAAAADMGGAGNQGLVASQEALRASQTQVAHLAAENERLRAMLSGHQQLHQSHPHHAPPSPAAAPKPAYFQMPSY